MWFTTVLLALFFMMLGLYIFLVRHASTQVISVQPVTAPNGPSGPFIIHRISVLGADSLVEAWDVKLMKLVMNKQR